MQHREREIERESEKKREREKERKRERERSGGPTGVGRLIDSCHGLLAASAVRYFNLI